MNTDTEAGTLAHPRKREHDVHIIGMILAATLCVAVGETLLSAGMRQAANGHQNLWLSAISNWRVILGVVFMTVYFGLYTYTLSLADISFVLPFTALSYLFVALFAHFFLHEHVTATRWIGALVIVLGVIIVGFGERKG